MAIFRKRKKGTLVEIDNYQHKSLFGIKTHIVGRKYVLRQGWRVIAHFYKISVIEDFLQGDKGKNFTNGLYMLLLVNGNYHITMF